MCLFIAKSSLLSDHQEGLGKKKGFYSTFTDRLVHEKWCYGIIWGFLSPLVKLLRSEVLFDVCSPIRAAWNGEVCRASKWEDFVNLSKLLTFSRCLFLLVLFLLFFWLLCQDDQTRQKHAVIE